MFKEAGHVARSVGHLTRKSQVLGSIPGQLTYFRFSLNDSWGVVVSYWQKYMHEVLVNRYGGLRVEKETLRKWLN